MLTAQQEVDGLGPWYHSMRFPSGVASKGEPYEKIWDNIRKIRKELCYSDAYVLDLATFDGMWAFEAEKLGASEVIATDCNWEPPKRFYYAGHQFKSNVTYLNNVSALDLVRSLAVYLKGRDVHWCKAADGRLRAPKFDIVQHLGLFYHLRDPLLSLSQVRSVIVTGGRLILETGFYDSPDSVMLFNGTNPYRIYRDPTTWWAPSLSCLDEVLTASLFRMDQVSSFLSEGSKIGRVCVLATAVDELECDPALVAELKNTYRNPGYEV